MKYSIICVGKIKEKYFVDAIKEYSKRLSRYADIDIIEVNDEKTPDQATDGETRIIKATEGKRILSKIKDSMYVIALDLKGKEYDSVAFSEYLSDLKVRGNSNIAFVIGGSLGLDEEVLKRANAKICFSKMTFPHQLMRVILLEQVYRGCRIENNEPYHK